jgi:hypothetical protein
MIEHEHFDGFKWMGYLGRASRFNGAYMSAKKCISQIPGRDFNALGVRGGTDSAMLLWTMTPLSKITEQHTGNIRAFISSVSPTDMLITTNQPVYRCALAVNSLMLALPENLDCTMISDHWDRDRADNPNNFYFVIQGGIAMEYDKEYKDRMFRDKQPLSTFDGICMVPPNISIDIANEIKRKYITAGTRRVSRSEKLERLNLILDTAYHQLCAGCGFNKSLHIPKNSCQRGHQSVHVRWLRVQRQTPSIINYLRCKRSSILSR